MLTVPAQMLPCHYGLIMGVQFLLEEEPRRAHFPKIQQNEGAEITPLPGKN